MVRKLVATVSAFLLACGLMPTVALAEEATDGSASVQLEPGTYVEHEAIAYVTDGADSGIAPFSLGGSAGSDLISNAQTLMDVGSELAAEKTGDGALASEAEPAALARSASSATSESEGRLVLVRDESKSVEELIAELEADERVVFAEPNYLLETPETDTEAYGEADGASASTSSAAAPTEDLTDYQWYADNDGVMTGQSEDAAPDVEYSAWKQAAESDAWAQAAEQERASLETVVVGVIDSGVDASNPDLAGVMWDDGNAYPELKALGGDTHGLSTNSSVSSTSPIDADSVHGTHVAGIIASEWNDFGTSGIAPNVEIMSLRTGSSISETLQSFNYIKTAVDLDVNVRVANCSWTLGATASQSLELGVSELGDAGVVLVFASGNDGSDVDKSIGMPSLLRDSSNVITVDAYDPSGDKGVFSAYGVSSTDVMAPGSSILSTYPMSWPSYIGEADEDAALYESFDADTRADSNITASGSPVQGGKPILQFTDSDGNKLESFSDSKRYGGAAALEVPYDAEAAQEDTSLPVEVENYQVIQSEPIDVSAVSDQVKYVSIRFTSNDLGGDLSADRSANVQIGVSVEGSSEPELLMSSNASRAVNTSWGGFYVELPDYTDYENFQITIYYINQEYSMLGGHATITPSDGTVLIDSIVLGDDLTPHVFMQGTSMAAPVVTGAVAVLAGQYSDESAEQLVARLKGGVQQEERYSSLCSTGGRVSVDGSQDPAPVPVESYVSADGSSIVVEGYFVDADTQVLVGGVACSELGRTSGSSDGLTEITVQIPEGFAGGEQWVELVTSDTERGRLYVDFGTYETLTYYDEADLPIPAELQEWSDWQLVGFAGDVYALPHETYNNVLSASHEFFLKYDPDSRSWSEVSFPLEQLKEQHCIAVGSASAATYDGALIIQVTGRADNSEEGVATYWRYTAQGEWEHIPMTFVEGEECQLMLSGLSSDGESLYAFGGYGTYDEYPGWPGMSRIEGILPCVVKLDAEKGEGSLAGMLEGDRENPQVTYRDGAFLVSGGQNTESQANSAMGFERVTPLKEAKTVPLERPYSGYVTYPVGWLEGASVDYSSVVTETGKMAWASAAVADGFVLVGPRSDSGKTDTYSLANQDGASLQEAGLNATHLALLNPTAVAYDGMLYVLAATSSDPYRVFAATAVSTVPQPGDYVEPDPDPDPDPDPVDPDSDPSNPDSGQADADGTLERLASTGDDLPVAPVAALAAAAAGCCAVALRGRRVRSEGSRKK